MRIATTASPVSGADVRDQMIELHLRFKIEKAVKLMQQRIVEWQKAKAKRTTSSTTSSLTDDTEDDLDSSKKKVQ